MAQRPRIAGPAGIAVLLVAFFGLADAWAQKVRTAIPRVTLNYLSVQVAEAKGYFRDEGMDNETIQIPGNTAVAALVSGDVHYSGAGGSGMRAAVRGAPIKAIMFQTEKVTWYLIAAPDVRKVADLKGKRVAVGTLGDTQDVLITMLVERAGLSGRDITRVAMPARNTGTTFLGLQAGAINAAVVNGDESILAEREGFNTLAFIGDVFPYPFQGFLATDRTIAERPGEIKKWLRAMVRSLMLIRDKPEEAADIAMKKIPMGNKMTRPLVVEGVRRFAKALPDGVPGLPSPQGLKNLIEFDVKAPLKMKEDLPPEKVTNFKLIKEVKDELEAKR
jgi:ABC-type nitrate/sulfonate/bicarbonate transport system substrate-binding protein